VTERAGVLNLGIEGMMLVGALAGFAVAFHSGILALGLLAGIAGGMVMSGIFAILVLNFLTNQVATGLALTLFGVGLSAFVGRNYVGETLQGFQPFEIPVLGDIPVFGTLLFNHDILVYGSVLVLIAAYRFLYHSRSGLLLRAIGEAPEADHSMGTPVIRVRYMAILFGGAMCGLAGAYLSLAMTPLWMDGMSAGRGWIALALVVFATWRPLRLLLGAYLFGVVTILQFHGQAMGIGVPSEFLSMLPYIATILVLVLISRNPRTIMLNQPASLGKPFFPYQ